MLQKNRTSQGVFSLLALVLLLIGMAAVPEAAAQTSAPAKVVPKGKMVLAWPRAGLTRRNTTARQPRIILLPPCMMP
jgi:hypothetical protein